MAKLRVGIIGCGMISDIYFKNFTGPFSNLIEVVSCANRTKEKADLKAQQYHVKSQTVEEMMDDPSIACIVNLTPPEAHYSLNKEALLKGKWVYTEKPLAINIEEGKELSKIAKEKGLYLGSAPDTFLGAGIQTALALIKKNEIGKIIGIQTNMLSVGPEFFHPNPHFFYKEGGGPILDMGPYYLAALVCLAGPIKEVSSFASSPFPDRTILRTGETFRSEVDTYFASLLHFENGVIGQLTVSWDFRFPSWESKLPLMEIIGSQGQIVVPDPNTFGGKVLLRHGREEFKEVPLIEGFSVDSRGLGLEEAYRAYQMKKTPYISNEFTLHVFEALTAIIRAGQEKRIIEIEDSCPVLDLFDPRF